jgi:hypothetical protein
MEPTLGQELIQIIIPLATVVVGAVTTWALAMLSAYIKSKTENETILTSYTQAEKIIKNTVLAINQSIKEAGADGKITAEEAKRIKVVAVESIRKQVPAWMKDSLELAVGDLEEWINTQIEASVNEAKNGK